MSVGSTTMNLPPVVRLCPRATFISTMCKLSCHVTFLRQSGLSCRGDTKIGMIRPEVEREKCFKMATEVRGSAISLNELLCHVLRMDSPFYYIYFFNTPPPMNR